MTNGKGESFGVEDRSFSNDCPDLPNQRIHQSLPIGVDPVAKEDEKQILLRVNPNRRPGEAAVAEGGWRERVTPVDRVAGIDIPAESAESLIFRSICTAGRDGAWRGHVLPG